MPLKEFRSDATWFTYAKCAVFGSYYWSGIQ